MALDSAASNDNRSLESLGDYYSRKIASHNRIIAKIEADRSMTKKSALLDLPAELRSRIWEYVLAGDGGVIHVDHKDVWMAVEMADRLNFTLCCRQIRAETSLMFLPNNTFLFQTNDGRKNYGILENMANWLYMIEPKELETIGRIVVCSKHPEPMVKWAWQQVQHCEMDAGFVVGKRLDKVTSTFTNKNGHLDHTHESWGLADGHHCNKAHYELVLEKKTKGNGKKKAELQ